MFYVVFQDNYFYYSVRWTSYLMGLFPLLYSWLCLWSNAKGSCWAVIGLGSCVEHFFWTGTHTSKKALIAWEQLYNPRTSRGLNLLDIHTWNKTAIGKLLWDLSKKKVYGCYGFTSTMGSKRPFGVLWPLRHLGWWGKYFKLMEFLKLLGGMTCLLIS